MPVTLAAATAGRATPKSYPRSTNPMRGDDRMGRISATMAHDDAPDRDGHDESAGERPSWEDVRDSWVGDVPQAAEHVAPPLRPPATIPPPLPGSVPPPTTSGARREAQSLACRHDALGPGIMMERLAASDYAGALRVAEAILRAAPGDADALQASGICRSELGKTYAARLGRGALVPLIAATGEELRRIPIDPCGGLVLSLIDGRRTIDQIAEAGRVPPLSALRVLSELFLDGVVVLLDADAELTLTGR